MQKVEDKLQKLVNIYSEWMGFLMLSKLEQY